MELQDYKKYIGKYIRNEFGIAKIIDVYQDEEYLNIFLKFDNNIVFNSYNKKIIGNTYPITENSKLEGRIKNLIDLIEVR